MTGEEKEKTISAIVLRILASPSCYSDVSFYSDASNKAMDIAELLANPFSLSLGERVKVKKGIIALLKSRASTEEIISSVKALLIE